MSRLAVIFPGIGYTADKPLLHYSRRIADRAGYEIKVIPYGGFPKKVKGDPEKMRRCFELALEQSEKLLAGIDLDSYSDILFIGKSVGTVAAAHIAAHSTHHSEAIVTKDRKSAELFTKQVDSAAVYVNASTRFTDGGQFGLGCEMGISTQKLHARGPMGLEELTSYKYVITGNGQIR